MKRNNNNGNRNVKRQNRNHDSVDTVKLAPRMVDAHVEQSARMIEYNHNRKAVSDSITRSVARLCIAPDQIERVGNRVFVLLRDSTFVMTLDIRPVIETGRPPLKHRFVVKGQPDINYEGSGWCVRINERVVDVAEVSVKRQLMSQVISQTFSAPCNGMVSASIMKNGDLELSAMWNDVKVKIAIFPHKTSCKEAVVNGIRHSSLASAFYTQVHMKRGSSFIEFDQSEKFFTYTSSRTNGMPVIANGYNGMTDDELDLDNLAQSVVEDSDRMNSLLEKPRRVHYAVRLDRRANRLAPLGKAYNRVAELAKMVRLMCRDGKSYLRVNTPGKVLEVNRDESYVVIEGCKNPMHIPVLYKFTDEIQVGAELTEESVLAVLDANSDLEEVDRNQLQAASTCFASGLGCAVDGENYVFPCNVINPVHMRPDTIGVILESEMYDETTVIATLPESPAIALGERASSVKFGDLVVKFHAYLPRNLIDDGHYEFSNRDRATGVQRLHRG